MKELKGVCTPICTVFTENGAKLNERAFLRHMDRLLEAGVDIIAVCGGTGEFPFLTAHEKRRIAEISARHIDGNADLIVQTSAIITAEAIEFSQHAAGIGADALLVLPPYFEGPDRGGVIQHYEQVAQAVEVPLMVYNIPVHSGFDITPDLYNQLRQIDNIRYIKDSTGDLLRLERLVTDCEGVFNGCDYLSFYGLLAGCSGLFWGGSNVMPDEAVALYRYCQAGDLQHANELWHRMRRSNMFFWRHAFNPSIKAACRIMGNDLGECRAPVEPLNENALAELRETLEPLLGGYPAAGE